MESFGIAHKKTSDPRSEGESEAATARNQPYCAPAVGGGKLSLDHGKYSSAGAGVSTQRENRQGPPCNR